MGDSKNDVVCHLTEREQVTLGSIVVGKIEAKNKDERRRKKEALRSFGLGWVKKTLEKKIDPTTKVTDLIEAYDKAIAGGAGKGQALVDTVNVAFPDRFRDVSDTPCVVSVSREVLSWMLDQLDKIAVGGLDDFIVADIEERLSDAKRGDYQLPPELRAELEEPPAPPEQSAR